MRSKKTKKASAKSGAPDTVFRAVEALDKIKIPDIAWAGKLIPAIPPQVMELAKEIGAAAKVAQFSQPLAKLVNAVSSMPAIDSIFEAAKAGVSRAMFARDVCNALEESDTKTLNLLIKNKKFDAVMLSEVVYLMRMDAEDRAETIKEQLAQSEEELARAKAEKQQQEAANKARTKKAAETKREGSRIPDIKAWFAKLEKDGGNIMDRNIGSEGAKEFEVSQAYIRKIRTEYIKEKSSKKRN